MHRVAGVAMQVVAFGRRDQECEEPRVGDQGAHRMNARPAVETDSCEEGEADAVLIHQDWHAAAS